MQNFHTGKIFVGIVLLPLMACNSKIPDQDDIVSALENANFMTEKITAERISSINCKPVDGMHECTIMYHAQKKRAANEIGIDKISRLRVHIELVGKRWRVSRVLTA